MSKLLGSARMDFLGNNSKFENAIRENVGGLNRQRQAMRRTRESAKKFNRTMAESTKRVLRFGAAVTGVGSVGALGGFVKRVADAGATIFETSKRFGLSAENLQLLQRAFEGEGGSVEGANKAIARFIRAFGEARSEIEKGSFATGTYSEAFRRLGLTQQQIIDSSPFETLRLVSDGMASLTSQTDRAAIGLELFGQRGAAMINVLQGGSAELDNTLGIFNRFGTVSDEQAASLKRLSQSITDFGTAIRIAFQKAVADQADKLARSIDFLTSYATGLGKALAGLVLWMPRLIAYAGAAAAVFSVKWVAGMVAGAIAVGKVSGALGILRLALIKTGIGIIIVAIGELAYRFVQLSERVGGVGTLFSLLWDVVKEAVGKISDSWLSLFQYLKAGWKWFVAVTAEAFADALDVIFDWIDDARKALSGFMGGVSNLFSRWDDVLSGAMSFDGARIARIWSSGVEEGEAASKKVGRSFVKTMRDAAVEANKAMEQAYADAQASFDRSQAPWQSLIPFQNALSKEPETPAADTGYDTGDDAVGNAINGIAKTLENNKKAVESWHDRWKEANNSISEGITDLMQTAIRDFDSLADKARETANKILDAFEQAFAWKPLQTALDTFADSLFKSIPAKAEGGWAYGPTIVGEKGAELVNFTRPAYVHTARETASMLGNSGGGTIYFAPNIQGGDPEQIRMEILKTFPVFKEEVMGEWIKEASRSGPIRSIMKGV